VTFKLTDEGDTNFFIEERNDLKADEAFILKREGVTLKENKDANAIRLFFDFGGSPAGTHVKISKIYFEEVLSLNYNDADNLSTQRENIESRLTDENGMFNGRKVADQGGIYVIEDAANRTFNPAKDYYYPIPTYEIATSEGSVVQNPGWN
jgi:hypothetical protein